jgi:hypothetical protein
LRVAEDDLEKNLRLAEGAVLTHELTDVEASAGMLSGDDDLALWAVLATGGEPVPDGGIAGSLPLVKDGVISGLLRVSTFYDLPPGYCDDAPIGQGMIAQFLLGPDGWLDGYQPDDVLALRLHEGAIEISRHTGQLPAGKATAAFREAATMAATDTLQRYGRGQSRLHIVPVDEVVLRVIEENPGIFGSPEQPLRVTLREAGLDAFGGNLGVRGIPWTVSAIRELGRAETVTAATALGMLLSPDHVDPRLILDHLASCGKALAFVGSEIEYRTAHGASFATRLSEMRGAAESLEDRSAVMFCEARASEGRGDSTTAASLVRQVLDLRPDWEPALMDAGEYVLSRGDARAADEYMSRVDHHTARMMRTDMAPLLVPPKSAISRNQPCPCGSGKKYKQCCLGKETHPLPDRAKAIHSLLLSYSQRPAFAETLARLVTRADVTEHTAMFCVNLVLVYGGIARFLSTRGTWLADDERMLVESWSRVPIGLHEITDVRSGAGVMLRTLPGGEPFFTADRMMSRSRIRRGTLLLGQAMFDGAVHRFLTVPVLVGQAERDGLLALLSRNPSAHELAAAIAPRNRVALVNGTLP